MGVSKELLLVLNNKAAVEYVPYRPLHFIAEYSVDKLDIGQLARLETYSKPGSLARGFGRGLGSSKVKHWTSRAVG